MGKIYIGQAKGVYQKGGREGRDFEQRKLQVFTKAEHEAKVGSMCCFPTTIRIFRSKI